MREITINGRRIADNELRRAEVFADANAKGHDCKHHIMNEQLLSSLFAEGQLTNRLLERIASSMSENRSDDDV